MACLESSIRLSTRIGGRNKKQPPNQYLDMASWGTWFWILTNGRINIQEREMTDDIARMESCFMF